MLEGQILVSSFSTTDQGLAVSDGTSLSPAATPGFQFDEARAKSHTCLGTLFDVKLSLQNANGQSLVFPASGANLRTIDECLYLICGYESTGDRCRVIGQGQIIGGLEEQARLCLDRLCLKREIEVECFVAVSRSGQGLTLDLIEARAATVDINIYGVESVADRIGESLANHALFLQVPRWKRADTEYRNPQSLGFSEVESTNFELKRTVAWALPVNNALRKIEEPVMSMSQETLAVEDAIDHYAEHTELVHAEVDDRIRTKLLDHQKQALEFIITRESASAQQFLTLWNDISPETGAPLYQHKITGAKSGTRTEALGGILADDMGLGKSLSVLAAVAGTLNQADLHAQRVATMTKEQVIQGPIPARCTLVLVPSTLLMISWRNEIESHVHNLALRVCDYHGSSRTVGLDSLLLNDIVVTTYATLASEYHRKQSKSRLHNVHWYRVVLDEAHVIRNPTTRQFKAVSALQSQTRWCLTGTPIQNTLEDLSSLVRFLRLPLLEAPVQFRRHIVAKIESKGVQPDYSNLRALLEAICLRRKKTVLAVPPSQEFHRELELTEDEQEALTRLKYRCKEAMLRAVDGHRNKETHQTVLHALLRLRIFCNNGIYYGDPGKESLTSAEEIESLLQQESGEAINCHYCTYDLVSLTGFGNESCGRVTGCRQFVCKNCLPEYRKAARSQKHCPLCDQKTCLFVEYSEEKREGTGPLPSKLLDLVEQVQHYRNEDHERGKGIVFSFWKRSLDIVGVMLGGRGIPYLRVDGSLPPHERAAVLHQFQHAKESVILLMTFSTGAVGLNNLSVASHVHILEPQWNPSVESQAIGRLVRLGQERSVRVVRYSMKGTVERHVRDKQVGKITLASDGFDQGSRRWLNEVLKIQ